MARGDIMIRPIDPRGGNEWTEIGVITSIEGLCHSLDSRGRALCGACLVGNRSPHPISTCCVDGHPRCSVCDELMMLPSEGVGGELEAA